MKMLNKSTIRKRKDEKGAALVMSMLVSFLLIAASAGMILSVTMNSANVTDATAEQQAYHAAESGIQSVVEILRYRCTAAVSPCKVRPTPLLDTSKPDYNKANTINYVKALTAATSNGPSDASPLARLSRWVSYNGSAATDRVKLAPPSATYDPSTGYAYTLDISDPDHTGNNLSFSARGVLWDHDAGNSMQKTYGSGANTILLRYTPRAETPYTITAGSPAATDFGVFNIQINGSGAQIPANLRFEITVRMTAPYPATRVIRGYLETNSAPYTNPPKLIFDSETYTLRGSSLDLNITGAVMRTTGSAPFGYEFTMVTSGGGSNPISGTVSAPEPDRLLVRSTGYGPRGATKTLEAIIQNNFFNGLGAPATITMVGPPSASNGNFTFDPGNSNAMLYSGQDIVAGSTDIIPPIGTTNPPDPDGEDPNLDAVLAAVGGHIANNVQGTPSNVSEEMPPWMATPAALDATVRTLYNVAINSYDASNLTGRYFPSGTQPSSWGDNASGTGITFCDGDCELGPVAGGGLLIVTGDLTLRGNFSFNGLIIVTGPGGVIRNGGGHGTIQGNIIVAPYDNSRIGDNANPAAGAGFLAPMWHTNGGGASTIQYNSNNQMSGLGAVSNVVLGVVEK
jgi:hypothetical protein